MSRMFEVLVQDSAKRASKYPLVDGHAALCCMESLAARGLSVVALTSANGIDEAVSLDDMREIYGDEARCVAARLKAQTGVPAALGQASFAF